MGEDNRVIKSALSGGISGMAAMGIQVTTLMWLRTTMNFQYKYGYSIPEAFKTIYSQGGLKRFYAGYTLAMIQGPLSRFGDTAANMGMLSLLHSYDVPIAVKTMAASSMAAAFRICLMPIDTMKTAMQVDGRNGLSLIYKKIQTGGLVVLFHGGAASSLATLAGHYPWYTTYNYLNAVLPEYVETYAKITRNAVIGFCASAVSDTASNSMRVLKTVRQTSAVSNSYKDVIKDILEKDGVQGLMGRGLKMRLITNCFQGGLFSVLWKLGQEYI